MDKKVSILTSCLNGEKFVAKYLESVLNQTYHNIELIFINDGSTDNTEKIVKSYIDRFEKKGKELIYIYQENKGLAASINIGLKIFKGDFICWADSDDLYHLESIEKRVRFLEKNKKYKIVRSDAEIIDENSNRVIGYFAKNNPEKYKESLFLDLIYEKTYFCCGCYMICADAFLQVNPKREIYVAKYGQNYQMLLPVMYKFNCGYIDEPLYTYFVRKNSLSHNTSTMNHVLEICNNHERILINTLKNIMMNDIEREKYNDIVKEKYIRKRLCIFSSYKENKKAKEQYLLLKYMGKNSFDDYLELLISKNTIMNILGRLFRKVKRSII